MALAEEALEPVAVEEEVPEPVTEKEVPAPAPEEEVLKLVQAEGLDPMRQRKDLTACVCLWAPESVSLALVVCLEVEVRVEHYPRQYHYRQKG